VARPRRPWWARELEALKGGRYLPLVGRCERCGPGYLRGDLWPMWPREREAQRPLGVVRCPRCGTEQGLWAPFQACVNGRCKRVLHLHLTSPALQAAVALGQVG